MLQTGGHEKNPESFGKEMVTRGLITQSQLALAENTQHTLNWLDLLRTQPRELFEEPLNQSIWIAFERWFGSWGSGAIAKITIVVPISGSSITNPKINTTKSENAGNLPFSLLENHAAR